MKRFLHQGKLPFKPIVDLVFHHTPPPSSAATNTVNPKPAIVNIHGILGSKRYFRSLNEPLARALNTDVYTVDLRNHGDSPFAQPFNYLTFTKDIIHFIKKHIGDKRPVKLMGFSLGGKVSLLTTLCPQVNAIKSISIDAPPYEIQYIDPLIEQNFGLVKKIVNREIRIEKGSKGWKKQVLELFRNLPANIGNKGDPGLYFAGGFFEVKANNSPPTADQKDPYLDHSSPLEEFPNLIPEILTWPDLSDHDGLEGLFNLSTDSPALFLKGLQSGSILDDYSLLKKHFPNAVVEEFDASHNIMIEKPKEFFDCVVEFLKDD